MFPEQNSNLKENETKNESEISKNDKIADQNKNNFWFENGSDIKKVSQQLKISIFQISWFEKKQLEGWTCKYLYTRIVRQGDTTTTLTMTLFMKTLIIRNLEFTYNDFTFNNITYNHFTYNEFTYNYCTYNGNTYNT